MNVSIRSCSETLPFLLLLIGLNTSPAFRLCGQATKDKDTTPKENSQSTVKKLIGYKSNETYLLDFKTGILTPNKLPFDVPFVLESKNLPKEITKVELSILNKKYAPCNDCKTECTSCPPKRPVVETNSKETEGIQKELEQKKRVYKTDSTALGTIKRLLEKEVDTAKKEELEKKQSEVELKAEKSKRELAERESNLKKSKESDKQKSLSRNGCDCKTMCSDFEKTCIRICPWEKDIFSKLLDTPKMHLEMPPLRANQEYSFYFKFYRSPDSTEKVELVNSIANYYVKTIHEQITNESKAPEWQIGIRDLIKGYYQQKLNEDVEANNDLLNNPKNFLRAVKNEDFVNGPDLLKTLIDNKQVQYVDYEANYKKAGGTWRRINSDATLRTTLTKIVNIPLTKSYYSEISSLISLLRKFLDISDLEISECANGRTNIDGLNKTRGFLNIIDNAIDVTPFSSNIASTIDAVKSATDGLNRKFIISDAIATDNGFKPTELNKLFGELKQLHSELNAVQSTISAFKDALVKIDNNAKLFGSLFVNQISFTSRKSLNSNSDFETRTEWYVSGDLGLAFVQYENSATNQFVPYYGINFNLFPINRQRKYHIFQRQYGCKGSLTGNLLRNFSKNLSVVVGLTVGSTSSPGISDTFSNNSLVTGLSVRISDPVRLSVGTVWNKVTKNSPVSSDKTLSPYVYVSLSFDLDLKTYLGKLANLWP